MEVALQSGGHLWNKLQAPAPSGLVSTVFNPPVKDRVWKITKVCVHHRTGHIATSDERGQVYCYSLDDNSYSYARLASTPVSALEFIQSRKNELMIAYQNGSIIVVNIESKLIVGTIHLPSPSPITLIRCHVKAPVATMVAQDGTLSMWDLRTLRCLRSLEVQDVLIDFNFELDGRLMSVVYQNVGVVFYEFNNGKPELRVELPNSERQPRWTAYACTRRRDRIFLAGENGQLYLFEVHQHSLLDAEGQQRRVNSSLLCAAEIPVEMGDIVSMSTLESSLHEHLNRKTQSSTTNRLAGCNLLLASSAGVLLIVNVSEVSPSSRPGADFQTKWVWRVVTEIHSRIAIPPKVGSLSTGLSYDKTARQVHALGCNKIAIISDVSYQGHAHHKLISQGRNESAGIDNTFFMGAVVCDDGSVQIYDWHPTLSEDRQRIQKGDITGSLLRHRMVGESTIVMQAQEAYQMGKNAQSHFHPNAAGNKVGFKKKSDGSSASREPSEHDSDTKTTFVSESLSELASRSDVFPKKAKMSRDKLAVFLSKNGRYPNEYRKLLWRYLLKLPENDAHFAELVKRGVHQTYSTPVFSRKCPLESRRLFNRLQGACSQLGHWSAIFGEIDYLPQLVFPFVLVFEEDELSALETVMTFMMWWGFAWHSSYPNPPMHVTDTADSLLQMHEPNLHHHLRSIGIAPGIIAWRLLQTLFSEFLSKESWLRLMDYVVTHFETLEYSILIPVALMRTCASAILSVRNHDVVAKFFSAQQDITVSTVISLMEAMKSSTPRSALMAFHRVSKTIEEENRKQAQSERVVKKRSKSRLQPKILPGARNRQRNDESSEVVEIDADMYPLESRATPVENLRDAMVFEIGSPVFPLPRGRYPAYDGYPKAVVDWELKKRAVQMSLNAELDGREEVLASLEERIAEIDTEHETWMRQHQTATEHEIKNRMELIDREKEQMKQLAYMEELISRKRLVALASVERASKEEMELLNSVNRKTEEMLSMSEEHLRSKMDAALRLQKHREMGEAAEAAMQDRINKILIDRSREERMKHLSETLQRAESEIDARAAQMAEQLTRLDAAAREKRLQRAAKARELAETEEAERTRASMIDRLTHLAIEREDKIAELEREVALRTLKEQAAEAEERKKVAALVFERQEAARVKEVAAEQANVALEDTKRRLNKLVDEARQYTEAMMQEEQSAQIKDHSARLRAREAEVRLQQIEHLQDQLAQATEAQIEAQNELLRVKRAALAREHEFTSHTRVSIGEQRAAPMPPPPQPVSMSLPSAQSAAQTAAVWNEAGSSQSTQMRRISSEPPGVEHIGSLDEAVTLDVPALVPRAPSKLTAAAEAPKPQRAAPGSKLRSAVEGLVMGVADAEESSSSLASCLSSDHSSGGILKSREIAPPEPAKMASERTVSEGRAQTLKQNFDVTFGVSSSEAVSRGEGASEGRTEQLRKLAHKALDIVDRMRAEVVDADSVTDRDVAALLRRSQQETRQSAAPAPAAGAAGGGRGGGASSYLLEDSEEEGGSGGWIPHDSDDSDDLALWARNSIDSV